MQSCKKCGVSEERKEARASNWKMQNAKQGDERLRLNLCRGHLSHPRTTLRGISDDAGLARDVSHLVPLGQHSAGPRARRQHPQPPQPQRNHQVPTFVLHTRPLLLNFNQSLQIFALF